MPFGSEPLVTGNLERNDIMNSCEAAVSLGALIGGGAALAAIALFILAAAAPKGARWRRHLLWPIALVVSQS